MNRARQNNGLTLAELLVAMIIGALVMVILVQGLSSMSKWSRDLRVLQDNSERTSSLFRFMQERLIRIEHLQIETEDGPQVLFFGAKDEIKFVVAETIYPANPGLYEQSLQIIKTDNENWQITFSRQPLIRLDEFGTNLFTKPLVLFNSASKPEFSFLGESGWQKQWDLPQAMPGQIAFFLEDWPAIIINLPRVSSDTTDKPDSAENENTDVSDE